MAQYVCIILYLKASWNFMSELSIKQVICHKLLPYKTAHSYGLREGNNRSLTFWLRIWTMKPLDTGSGLGIKDKMWTEKFLTLVFLFKFQCCQLMFIRICSLLKTISHFLSTSCLIVMPQFVFYIHSGTMSLLSMANTPLFLNSLPMPSDKWFNWHKCCI